MAQTVVGLFDTSAEAQQAVETLTSRGFTRANIDVSNTGSGSGLTSSSSSHDSSHEGSGIGNFFKSLFSDDDDHAKYTSVAQRSGSIVTVHAQSADEAEDAADILDDCGAVNVDERAASYGYTGTGTTGMGGTGTSDFTTGTAATGLGLTGTTGTSDFTDNTTTGGSQKIPIIEENLEVGKREVVRGGVRVRSRIVERPVEESLRLREESVRVERNPVNRTATSADLANFEGTQIEMTESAEVPVVSKEARVVEEVSLGKEVTERTETISDTVRKTEVDVDNIEGTSTTRKTDY
jgi:uncharacterized protein (TIGR02271 family)